MLLENFIQNVGLLLIKNCVIILHYNFGLPICHSASSSMVYNPTSLIKFVLPFELISDEQWTLSITDWI